jgi:eukaryotic-like serine/threonine-protein kinase
LATVELRICQQCQELMPPGLTRCSACQGAIGVADAWALVGRELGRYRLTELVGAGGMGLVYAAEHTGLLRRVALKLLLPSLDSPEFLERFRREARMLAELRHPHIVEIYDFDVTAAGLPYYAMELLEGMSLATALQRQARPQPLASLGIWLRQIGAALDYAHRHRVIHRDLKPDNIFLARSDGGVRIKLLDFGIAKKLGSDAVETSLTLTGAMIGTPLYLTPETIAGGPVDARADQYALALIVAECLLGHPLRQGLSLTEILYRAQHHPIAPTQLPDTLPAAARVALVRATEPDPAQRHASVLDFIAALELPDSNAGSLLDLAAPASTTPALATTTPAGLVAAAPAPPKAAQAAAVPAVPKLARVGSQWRLLALLAVVTVALGLSAWWWTLQPGNRTSASADLGSLSEAGRFTTPADAGTLIGIASIGAVLRTAGGVYLRPLDATRESTRRNDRDGEQLLGVTENDEFLLRRGDRIYALDPQGGAESLRLQLPEAAEGALAWRRDGRALAYVHGQEIRLLEGDQPPRTITRINTDRLAGLQLGERQILIQLQQPVAAQILALDGLTPPWSLTSEVGRLHDLAWDEAGGRVAFCGFAPQVEIHTRAGFQLQSVPVTNNCYAALWLPGGEQLLLRSDHGLQLWNGKQSLQLPLSMTVGGIGMSLPRLRFHHGQVLLAEVQSGLLLQFDLGGDVAAAVNPGGGAEVWDLLSRADAQYVAHADGSLLKISGNTRSVQHVHEAGITDLVGDDQHIASASDDRTLAVWRSSDLSVSWRTRGHDFLINQLWLAPDQSALWSSSSDGSLKRWRWPELEITETVDLRQLLAAPELSLHALWFSADQREALVGTWNQRLIRLQRNAQGWQAQAMAVGSKAGYRLLECAAVDAVALLGTEPTRLWLWDRRQQRLVDLPELGLELYALAPGSGPDRLMAAGSGALVEYQLQRSSDGMLSANWRVLLQSRLGTVGAADVDPVGRRWWLGNQLGEVRALGFDQLPASVTASIALHYR